MNQTGPVSFSIQAGDAVDASGNPTPAATSPTVTYSATGFECDVSPRPNGDGSLNGLDVGVLRAMTTEQTFSGNEFQRADANDDGRVDGLDVGVCRSRVTPQTYVPAAGPNAPTTPALTDSNLTSSGSGIRNLKVVRQSRSDAPATNSDVVAAPRTVYPQAGLSAAQGATNVVVPILVDAAGDEGIYSFTLTYDATKLTYVSTTAPVAPAQSRFVGATPTISGTVGRVAILVDFNGATINAGNGQVLVNVTFNVSNTAATGSTFLNFTDVPLQRTVGTPNGAALAFTYQDGTINILAPTAAGVNVDGRVVALKRGVPEASVTITDSKGVSQTVLTDARGYYHFEDIASGETYTISVKAKRFNFEPKVITINESLTGVDFTAGR